MKGLRMESIEAAKTVFSAKQNKNNYMERQGLGSPLLIGIVTYAFTLSFALACGILWASIV